MAQPFVDILIISSIQNQQNMVEQIDGNNFLIEEVKRCPSLFNSCITTYRDKELRNKLWNHISSKCGIPADILRRKWTTLRERYVKEMRLASTQANYISKFKHLNEMHFLKDVIKFRTNSNVKVAPGNTGVLEQEQNVQDAENEEAEEADNEADDDDQVEFIITEEDLREDNRDLSDIFVELSSDEEQDNQEQQHQETNLQNELNRQQLKETCFNISDDLELQDFECDELEDIEDDVLQDDIELTPKNELTYESVPFSTSQESDIRNHVINMDCQQQEQEHTDTDLLETLQNDVDLAEDQNSSYDSKSTQSNLSDHFEIEVHEQQFEEELEQPKEEPIEYQQQEEDPESEREMKEEEHTDETEKRLVVPEPPLKKFKRKKGRLVKQKIQKYNYGMNEDMIFGELITSMLMKIEDEAHKKKVKKEILSLFF